MAGCERVWRRSAASRSRCQPRDRQKGSDTRQRCCVALHSCAYQQENWPRRNNAIGHPPQIRAPFLQVPYGVRVPLAPPRLNRCRLWHRQRRVVHVDAINTFGVSAGRLAYFRVVSRGQIQCFHSSRCFLRLVRFPAAPQERCWSEPQALASFLFHQEPMNIDSLSSPYGVASGWQSHPNCQALTLQPPRLASDVGVAR